MFISRPEDYKSIETPNKNEALVVKKSLNSLKNIIKLLANHMSKGIISFQNSILTYELRSALERKCHISMIVNVDSNDQCFEVNFAL